METLGREDIERLMFFESAREQAESEFKANNKDALALTKWGGALLELAHFRQGNDAYDMIEEAIAKFQHALGIDSKRHDALWCLGNAYTSQGFLSADSQAANRYFDQAADCFQKASKHDPTNDSYRRALEMSAKAPQLYLELQRQLQAASAGGSPRGAESRQAPRAPPGRISDFWYDIAGWGALVALGFGVVALSRSAPTPASG